MANTLLLTPGFRFHPTDVELVKYYLKRKVLGKKFIFEAIAELDIYKHAPWDLPAKSCLKSKDLKWYFFCPKENKYACGARRKRATDVGYWKTTGKDRPVTYNGDIVGMIKTLVFHIGRAPNGDRTDWVMHEYRLEEKGLADRGVVQDSYVLCVVFKKDGPGPRNGAQYGAKFVEEEWTDDEGNNCIEVGSSAEASVPNSLVPDRDYGAGSSKTSPSKCLELLSESCVSGSVIPSLQVLHPVSGNDVGHNNSVASRPHALKSTAGFGFPPESCVSDAVAPSCKLPQTLSGNDVEVEKLPAASDDDILSLDDLTTGGPFMMNDKNKDTNNVNQDDAATGAACSEEADIFEDLGDLGYLAGLNAHKATCTLDEIFSGDDGWHFMELMDLDAPLACPTGAAEDEDVELSGLSAGLNCYPNSGDPSFHVKAVQTTPWPDGARGSEQHCFDPRTAAQNPRHE